MSCLSASVSLPPIGILPESINCHNKLRSGLPGAIAGPLEPPAISPANELRSIPAIFF